MEIAIHDNPSNITLERFSNSNETFELNYLDMKVLTNTTGDGNSNAKNRRSSSKFNNIISLLFGSPKNVKIAQEYMAAT